MPALRRPREALLALLTLVALADGLPLKNGQYPGQVRELRRVLNRGEAVNALKQAIHTGRVGPTQARRAEEMQEVADALSLLADIVMAWNTTQMQAVLDRWANRRQVVPPELLGRIAPTRLEGINLRGAFSFPVVRYPGQLMPSQTAGKTSLSG